MDLSIASSLFETTNSQNGQSSLHTTIFEGVQGEESAWTSEECDQKLKADHEISSQSRGVKDFSSVSAKEEQTLSVSLSMNENSGETVSAQHRSIDLSPNDKTAKVEVSRHEEPIISSSSLHPVQVLERNEEDKEQEGEQLSQSKQPAEPENHFDAKDAVQLLNHENSKETTSELINENQDHSEFTEVRIKEDSSSERGGEPNKSDQINSQSSEPVDIPPPQTVALENTSQKESHVTASPLSTKYSENELFNLVGMSLSKNFVKNFNNASAANSPSHTMPSASLEVQTASVSEIVHQRQDHAGKERRELKIVADQPLASDSPLSPLMQDEAKDLAISPNKLAALEPVNWQSANGEEDLSTNQLSALLNRMQHRLNDITANDEDFTPPLPSPKRISRLLSGEISIMSDLTFSNSENNTPLTTPVQSFLINQTSLDKSPQIKRQSGVPSSQLDKTTSPSLLRKAAAPTLEVKVIQPPSRDRKDQKRGRSSDALAKSSGGPRNRSKSPASSTYSETVLGRTTVFAFGRAIHANERGRSKTPVENRNANTGNTIRASSKGRSKSPTATSSMNTVSRLSGRSKSSSSTAYPTTYRSQSPAINNRSSTRAHSKSPASSLKIPFSNINARARSKSPAINSRLYSTPKNDFKARRARSLTPNPKRSAGMKSSARSKSPAVTFSRSTIDRASAVKKRSASADGWRQLSKGDYPRRSSFNDPTMSFLNRVAANSQRMSRSVSSSHSVITELAQGGSFVINSLGSRVSLLSSWNRAATDSPPVMNPAAPRRSSVGAASSRDSMGALTASRATRSSYPVETNRSSAVPPSKLSQDKSVRPQATTPLKAGGGTKANTLTPPATSTSRISSTITNSGQSATPTSAVSQRGLQTPSKYTPPGKQQFVGKVHISPLANQQSSSDPSVTNALSGGRLSQQYEHSGEKQSKAASWYSSNYAAETAVKTVRGSNSKQITITITDKQTKHKRANSDSSGAIKIDQSQTSMRSASPKVVSANIKHSTNKERAFSSNSPANAKKAISSDDESPEKIAESKIKPESSPIIRKILSAEVAEDHKMTEQREQENAAIDTFPTHRDADSTPISSPWNEERQDRRSSPLSNISTVPPPIITILSSESPDPVGFGRISRRESPKRSFSPRKIDSNTLNRVFESQVASSSLSPPKQPIMRLSSQDGLSEHSPSKQTTEHKSSPISVQRKPSLEADQRKTSPPIVERKGLTLSEQTVSASPTVTSAYSTGIVEQRREIEQLVDDSNAVKLFDIPPIESEEAFKTLFPSAKPIPLFSAAAIESKGSGGRANFLSSTKTAALPNNNNNNNSNNGNKSSGNGNAISSYKQKLKKKEKLIFMPSLKHTLQKTIDTVYKVTKLREDSKSAMTNIQSLISKSSSMDFDEDDFISQSIASPRAPINGNRYSGTFNHLASHHFHNENLHFSSSLSLPGTSSLPPPPPPSSTPKSFNPNKHFYSYKKSLSVRNIQKLLTLANVSYSTGGDPGDSPKRARFVSVDQSREDGEHSLADAATDPGPVRHDDEDADTTVTTENQSAFTFTTIKTNFTARSSSKPLQLLTTQELIEEMKAKVNSGEPVLGLGEGEEDAEEEEDDDEEEEQEESEQEEAIDSSVFDVNRRFEESDIRPYVPAHLLPETNNTTALLQSLIPFMSSNGEKMLAPPSSDEIAHSRDSRRFTLSLV